jgi:hypothetical protein
MTYRLLRLYKLTSCLSEKIIWINLREEPVCYINGNPYVSQQVLSFGHTRTKYLDSPFDKRNSRCETLVFTREYFSQRVNDSTNERLVVSPPNTSIRWNDV